MSRNHWQECTRLQYSIHYKGWCGIIHARDTDLLLATSKLSVLLGPLLWPKESCAKRPTDKKRHGCVCVCLCVWVCVCVCGRLNHTTVSTLELKRGTRLRVKVIVGVALPTERAVVASLLQGKAMVAVAITFLPDRRGHSKWGQCNPRLVADQLGCGGLTANASRALDTAEHGGHGGVMTAETVVMVPFPATAALNYLLKEPTSPNKPTHNTNVSDQVRKRSFLFLMPVPLTHHQPWQNTLSRPFVIYHMYMYMYTHSWCTFF